MSQQPHIIYILSDEHFGGAMSHMGDANVQTPTMDRMAAEGISLKRAYANCPICTPSRGTIFSGRHAHAGPVQYFFDVYKASAPSLATRLREAGYHTAYFGKWHCGVVNNQEPPQVRDNRDDYTRWAHRTPEYYRAGFQDWYGFEINNAPFDGFYYHQQEANPRKMDKYQTDFLTDLAIDYLKHYDGDKPLFLVLSVEPPHFPLQAPQEFIDRFNPAALEVPPTFEDTPAMRKLLAIYYAMVENLDMNIGRLRHTLSQIPGFQNNTLSIYFSDHGDYMGTHGTINRKENPHEQSVRVPAIFHWPDQIPAQDLVENSLFGLVDLFATTLGLVGLDIPAHNQGVDFSPLLRGEPFSGPKTVLLEMSGNPRWDLDFLDWRGLVTKKWKYAFYETGHEWLFDLENDPYEQINLAETEPEILAQMRQKLLQLMAETREPYFDVLLEHGVKPDGPAFDVGLYPNIGKVSPHWADMVEPHPDV